MRDEPAASVVRGTLRSACTWTPLPPQAAASTTSGATRSACVRIDRSSTKPATRATLVHRLRPGGDVTRRRHLLLAGRLLASVGMLAYLLTRFTRFHLSSLLPRW